MKYIIFLAALFALVASVYSTPTNSTGSAIAESARNVTRNATATSTISIGRRQANPTNPFILPLISGKSVALSGVTNAAFTQRVTILNNVNGAAVITFQGTGEDVSMVTLDPTTGAPTTMTCFTLPQQIGGMSLSLAFTFSETGQPPFVLASLKPPHGTNIVNLESEDSTDNDNNDTEFEVSFQTGNSPGC